MSDQGEPSRGLAIGMLVLTGLAFVAIIVGLAMGQLAVSGTAAVVLVILWFLLRSIQRRGGD
ncbi:MAG: hypothetical protein FJW99_00325 [Actinobacteria bacterium]|nr:hypothetical protein [Actinomycetota bacterium]